MEPHLKLQTWTSSSKPTRSSMSFHLQNQVFKNDHDLLDNYCVSELRARSGGGGGGVDSLPAIYSTALREGTFLTFHMPHAHTSISAESCHIHHTYFSTKEPKKTPRFPNSKSPCPRMSTDALRPSPIFN